MTSACYRRSTKHSCGDLVIVGTAEDAHRHVKRVGRNMLVGLAQLEVCAENRLRDLHQLFLLKYCHRCSVHLFQFGAKRRTVVQVDVRQTEMYGEPFHVPPPDEVVFEEHDHDHMNLGDEDDAHARAHADDIRRRFAGRTVTTGQIVMFGLTGGLIPCPAAITVLLLCIQLKQFSLGFALVVCFSIGLALTIRAGHEAPGEDELKELIRARLRSSRVPDAIMIVAKM